MLISSLGGCSDVYILVKETTTVANTALAQAAANNVNKEVIFKNCIPFTDCISKINHTQTDNAKDIDVVMPMYNLGEYSDDYSKTSGNLGQYNGDEPALNNASVIVISLILIIIALGLSLNKK